jgi:predicted aspartyl protease
MRIHRVAAALAGALLHVAAVSTDEFDARIARMDAGLVIVPVHVNGSGPHRFVVDTAATTTTLDRDFADTLGLVSAGGTLVLTASGSFDARTMVIDDLRIGKLRAGAVRATVMSLAAFRSSADGIVGVLGQDVLSRTTLTVDYRRRRVHMADAACEPGDASLEASRADGRPMVAAHVAGAGGAGARRLVIDSAADGLVLFARARGASGAAIVNTHAGTTPAAVVESASVRIADLAFRQPAYLVEPPEARIEDGLLPASWFARICLDGPRNLVVLTR